MHELKWQDTKEAWQAHRLPLEDEHKILQNLKKSHQQKGMALQQYGLKDKLAARCWLEEQINVKYTDVQYTHSQCATESHGSAWESESQAKEQKLFEEVKTHKQ